MPSCSLFRPLLRGGIQKRINLLKHLIVFEMCSSMTLPGQPEAQIPQPGTGPQISASWSSLTGGCAVVGAQSDAGQTAHILKDLPRNTESKVDPSKCAACLTCVRLCPYGAPRINEDHKAEILEALCQGCGICASVCPGKAIELQHFRDDQVFQEIDSLLDAAS